MNLGDTNIQSVAPGFKVCLFMNLLSGGEVVEGLVRKFRLDMYTLLYLKWIANKDCSMLCGSLDGRGVWGRMATCIYMAESLPCLPETITTHPNTKFKVIF